MTDSTKSYKPKSIRFVNSSFKEIFRIKDGERIVMKFPTGELNIVRCEYIDAYHFKGRSVYHIFQFATMCAENHIRVMPYQEWLRKGMGSGFAGHREEVIGHE